ncbi:o-succinylbenzoate--CoA ligase [Bertholletia excelsa]
MAYFHEFSFRLQRQKICINYRDAQETSFYISIFRLLHPPDGTAIICFTSGTTGKPKGVAISHSALIVQSLAKLAIVRYNEDDVYLHTIPLCHIGGISSAMAMLMAGGCHVFLPKFEAKSVIEAIDQLHVTAFTTVPAIMADIISLIRMERILKGKASVKKILNGAGSLSAELIKNVSIFFPKAKLISAYGMTETGSSLTFLTLYDPASGNSVQPFHTSLLSSSNQLGAVCVGKPASHVELKISLEDSSHVGRILTRGPHVMLGYWGQSPKIASNASDEGWLDTGDIGQFDDFGNLWLIGRSKDRIKSGGLTVYPEEVEAVLSQHPGVSRIVVVGLPDPRSTEMVAACVKLNENWKWDDSFSNQFTQRKNQTLSAEILRQFCKEKHLSGFKIPRRFILWRKQFPLTSTGKRRRDEVRREAMSCVQSLPSRL